jgi:hypothetical protein
MTVVVMSLGKHLAGVKAASEVVSDYGEVLESDHLRA